MLDIKVEEGNFVIKRVANGWIVNECVSGLDENKNHSLYFDTSVYEDTNGEECDAESLSNMLIEVFADYRRQKNKGGFDLKYEDKGYYEQ